LGYYKSKCRIRNYRKYNRSTFIPATDRGLKFHAAAQELNLISDEFFKLRNHNPQFKNKIKEIKDEIKVYRKDLDDSEEVASTMLKILLKLQEE
jgi:taurine transport system permease protein